MKSKPNVIYPALEGKKCNYCYCFFSCSDDMDSHLRAFGRQRHDPKKRTSTGLTSTVLNALKWKPSTFGDKNGEWCSSSSNTSLKKMLNLRGNVRIGLFDYNLSRNGKWFLRKKVA